MVGSCTAQPSSHIDAQPDIGRSFQGSRKMPGWLALPYGYMPLLFSCCYCTARRTALPLSHNRSVAQLACSPECLCLCLPCPAQVLTVVAIFGWALVVFAFVEVFSECHSAGPCAARAPLAIMRRRWAAQAAQRSQPASRVVHSPASHLSDSPAAASRTPEAPQLAAGPASVSLDSSFQVVDDVASQHSSAPEVVDLTGDSDLRWYFRKAPVLGSPKPLPSDQHSPASKASPPGHCLKLSPHGDLPTVADLARPPTQHNTAALRRAPAPPWLCP